MGTIKKNQTNAQAGFAIGVILMAVVLIAAIVAGISISNQGSTAQATRQQNAMIAGVLSTLSLDIVNGINQAQKNGFELSDIILNDNGCTPTQFCLFSPVNGLIKADLPTGATTQNSPWTINTLRISFENNVPSSDAGTAADDTVLFLKNVSEDVCKQVNILNNDFYTTSDLQSVFAAETDADYTNPSAGHLNIVGNLSNYHPMGCFYENSEDTYYLYRIIDAN